MIPLHALSGCDTVPVMFNIGKVKCINVAKKHPFQHLGKIESEIENVLEEGKRFVVQCYGLDNTNSSENRSLSVDDVEQFYHWLSSRKGSLLVELFI